MRYVYNPECDCRWCANGGASPGGRWITSAFYGRVWDQGPNDCYDNPHRRPAAQMKSPTSTYGGQIDQRAVIGHAPEDRDWKPGDPSFEPFIGPGARIEAFVTVDAGKERPTVIGLRTWLMKHVHVGHDAQIGADCELAPGAVICGHAEIGDSVKVGVNASVLPYRKVGAGARIGAGAVITKDVPAGEIWVGNPARPLEARILDHETALLAE